MSKVISSLEEELASKSGTLYKHYQRKAKQLAHYMITDEPGANLLTNANTIAHLFGEGIKVNNIEINGLISTTKEELDFMDDFIEWLESRGETFFGLTYKLKEEEE